MSATRCPFEWDPVDTLNCRISSKRHRCILPAGHDGGLHQCGACSSHTPDAYPVNTPPAVTSYPPWTPIAHAPSECGPVLVTGGKFTPRVLVAWRENGVWVDALGPIDPPKFYMELPP